MIIIGVSVGCLQRYYPPLCWPPASGIASVAHDLARWMLHRSKLQNMQTVLASAKRGNIISRNINWRSARARFVTSWKLPIRYPNVNGCIKTHHLIASPQSWPSPSEQQCPTAPLAWHSARLRPSWRSPSTHSPNTTRQHSYWGNLEGLWSLVKKM